MKRGFLAISTLDRLDDLRRMIRSLQIHNSEPVCVMLAKDKIQAHEFKTICASLSPFDFTIMLDTDIYINGNLGYLFKLAEQGFIAMHHEGIYFFKEPVHNSGVIAFDKKPMMKICYEWNIEFRKKVIPTRKTYRGTYDQHILNTILYNNKGRMQFFSLPAEYNWILKHHTPAEELASWKQIKIFHFLHDQDPVHPINKLLYKSWNLYHK